MEESSFELDRTSKKSPAKKTIPNHRCTFETYYKTAQCIKVLRHDFDFITCHFHMQFETGDEDEELR